MRTPHATSAQSDLSIVERREDLPAFGSEAEEHAFWATHELSDALWAQAEPLTPDELPTTRSKTTAVVVHLDEQSLARLRALARRQHAAVQTFLDAFVRERLEEEEQRSG